MERVLRAESFHMKIKNIDVYKKKNFYIFTLKVEFKLLNKKNSNEHLKFNDVLILETELKNDFYLKTDLKKVQNFDFLFSFEYKLLNLIEENLHGDLLEKIKSDIF